MRETSETVAREKKLKALELKMRMRKFAKLAAEMHKTKEYLLNDIKRYEQAGDELPIELLKIREELNRV